MRRYCLSLVCSYASPKQLRLFIAAFFSLPFHHPRITGTVKLAFNEQERTMNKRVIGREAKNASPLENEWLALEDLAQVEVTSEDPTHPIELGLLQNRESGWRAAGPGPQIVRLIPYLATIPDRKSTRLN